MKLYRLLTAALLAATLTFSACRVPHPGGDGGNPAVTPSSWTDTADTIVSILEWAIPAARLIISGFTATAPEAVTGILSGVDIVRSTTLPGFRAAVAAYKSAGGDRCAARASGELLLGSLLTIADTSGAAGWGLAAPIHTALSSLGAILDALAPVCRLDGGLTAGVSADMRISSALTARPAALRPFPEIHPPAADAGH